MPWRSCRACNFDACARCVRAPPTAAPAGLTPAQAASLTPATRLVHAHLRVRVRWLLRARLSGGLHHARGGRPAHVRCSPTTSNRKTWCSLRAAGRRRRRPRRSPSLRTRTRSRSTKRTPRAASATCACAASGTERTCTPGAPAGLAILTRARTACARLAARTAASGAARRSARGAR